MQLGGYYDAIHIYLFGTYRLLLPTTCGSKLCCWSVENEVGQAQELEVVATPPTPQSPSGLIICPEIYHPYASTRCLLPPIEQKDNIRALWCAHSAALSSPVGFCGCQQHRRRP